MKLKLTGKEEENTDREKKNVEQKRVKAEITTAVCNLMSLAGRLKAEKEKDKKRL